MSENILEIRKKDILRMIVEQYTSTAKPVSSEAIAAHFNLSPATIRHVMAELEHSNHITHPYTSAGRIPTDKGYRYYVDDLIEKDTVKKKDDEIITQQYINEISPALTVDEYEKVFSNASSLLSQCSHYPSVVSTPKLEKKEFIKEIKFIPLDKKRVIVTLITNTHTVKSRIIFLKKEINNLKLEELSNYLTNKLKKQRIEKRIRQGLENELGTDFICQAETIIDLACNEEKDVFLEGANRLLEEPEFRDTENLKRIFNVFETSLYQILQDHIQSNGVCVSIGHENSCQDIQSCSLVTSSYKIKDKTAGIIGVIGPTRMKYSVVIPIVEFMSNMLGNILTKLSEKED